MLLRLLEHVECQPSVSNVLHTVLPLSPDQQSVGFLSGYNIPLLSLYQPPTNALLFAKTMTSMMTSPTACSLLYVRSDVAPVDVILIGNFYIEEIMGGVGSLCLIVRQDDTVWFVLLLVRPYLLRQLNSYIP